VKPLPQATFQPFMAFGNSHRMNKVMIIIIARISQVIPPDKVKDISKNYNT
tara:strand:+ start:8731 stop:8883 length:153 start_codon:yes stop_codon:yes gene_type:complete